MANKNLCYENVWLEKSKYEDAECYYYEQKAREIQTPLAAEVGRAREWLTNIKKSLEEPSTDIYTQLNPVKRMEDQILKFEKIIASFEAQLSGVIDRVKKLEELNKSSPAVKPISLNKGDNKSISKEDDDVDLFGSESDEDEGAAEIREKRLAEYAAKKSKKPVLIAKSNIILDVKPWDDETDMKVMEAAVREIHTEGLLWGAAKLVPLAYGIHKLQISCVVEDDLVSIDWLQEQIEEISDYVQSVDIAAFNKV